LISNLEYPKGVWVRGNKVYFTETAGRNTSSGGAIRLSSYDMTSRQVELILDRPMNSDAVVVASTGKIYLASYAGAIPGDKGAVSVVDPISKLETPVVDVPIAASDMYIDATDDIYLIGSSASAQAKSILRLPASNYAAYEVVKTGLGRADSITLVGSTVYFTRIMGGPVQRFSGASAPENFGTQSARTGLTASATYLYFGDFQAGTIGRAPLATGEGTTSVRSVPSPIRVRFSGKSLFYLTSGTSGAEYRDGTLNVWPNVEP
jgi:hypothetical protein